MVSGGKMWSKTLAQRRCGRTWLPIPSRGVSPPGRAQGSGTASLLLHDPCAGEAQRQHAHFWEGVGIQEEHGKMTVSGVLN